MKECVFRVFRVQAPYWLCRIDEKDFIPLAFFFWLYVCFAGKVVVVIFFCLLLLFTVMVLCGVKRRVSERVRARDRGGG